MIQPDTCLGFSKRVFFYPIIFDVVRWLAVCYRETALRHAMIWFFYGNRPAATHGLPDLILASSQFSQPYGV